MRVRAITFAVLLVLAGCGDSTPIVDEAVPGATLEIRTLSNRSDLLSGGDVLVELVVPAHASLGQLRVSAAGRDVTSAFARRADSRVLGRIENLPEGPSELRATLGNQRARLTLVQHSIEGPIFAGPQVQPWLCATEAHGLGPARDAQCHADAIVLYVYRDRLGVFREYDPQHPPADVPTTTTDHGLTVPYVVRLERGTMNRGIYEIAVLADPRHDGQPWAPHAAWNGKLLTTFGGGAAPYHRQSAPDATLDHNALSRGFMVASSGLLTHGRNTNETVSAETLMMLKEHIIDRYGPIRYTIGQGCSGGSLQQHMIAAAYPGLLDGLIPSCSYPDTWTTMMTVLDCSLLQRYFNRTSPQLWPVPSQRLAVEGTGGPSVCLAWDATYAPRLDAGNAANCDLPEAEVYDAASNPQGTRCTINDYQVAVWGLREPAQWNDTEAAIGRGFAARPLDNIGVQYGLAALQQGSILPEQFLDLNEKIGGMDIDGQPTPHRVRADPGTAAIAYRTAQITDARPLARVPIIDLRGHDQLEIHTDEWSHVLRARLDQANGHHANQVIFTGAIPLMGDPAFACSLGPLGELPGVGNVSSPTELCTFNPLLLMDRWLEAIDADDSDAPLAEKVVHHKPAAARDTCFVAGLPITDSTTCAILYPHFSMPRVVAGGPFAHNIVQCRLRPLHREDYAQLPVPFTDMQWERMHAIFAGGVCDWPQPGEGEQPSEPWMSFQDGSGGRPLGPPPQSRPS